MARNRIGSRTLEFRQRPRLVSAASIVSKTEAEGPLGDRFDMVLPDDTWGEDSFEKAERRMFETAVRIALDKVKLDSGRLDCLLGGDLLNQIISANFAARQLLVPFLGLYGACSTMAESLLVGGVLVDGGYADTAACAASSHFSTAERQYRYPLEMGTTSPPTAQRTVTGAGCALLSGGPVGDKDPFNSICLAGATIGRVIDLGITDANNMGAAMAPAAADTILAHLGDMQRGPEDYDLIITGDLGRFGAEMLFSLCQDQGVDLSGRHLDCGNLIFHPEQKFNCGGSGCGCSAVTLAAFLLDQMEQGDVERMLFLATGALLSPGTTQQGDSIPSIAHAVVLERGGAE
ncbi:MAG: stage V sporulation protein AD [Clostridia bacterium]|nr:stage V sporulation protein AD [Clostridia bacterium]